MDRGEGVCTTDYTPRSGSSGSPVFDNGWRLIGVHHAGGVRMPQLNNTGGTYAANEGITFGPSAAG